VRASPFRRATRTLRAVFVLGVSVIGIVLIVAGALILLFLIGGVIAVVVRSRRQASTYDEHVAAADAALEQARAVDKGWHRDTMETVAREAIAESRPGWTYDHLHLVFVDDRPGMSEDRAHFMAVGPDGEARVILARQDGQWVAERVE
jgi:hypothetical protein